MQEPTARHSYVHLNGSFVHLLQICCSGESVVKQSTSSPNVSLSGSTTLSRTTDNSTGSRADSSSRSDLSQKILVFIPGNPGMLGIYYDFLISLYRSINGSIGDGSGNTTILAMSHNDFDHPDYVNYKAEERIYIGESDLNFVERSIAKNLRHEPHHMELQVLNKIIILKHLLKVDLEDCRIVFVGHSIGCYVILRVLQDRLIASAHEGTIMIHPALENLAKTERGSVVRTIFDYKLHLLAHPIALAVDWLLPRSAKLALTKWFCSQEFVQRSSDMVVESIFQLVSRKPLNALLQMAQSELASVKNINTDVMIKPHASKLKLIYAINDNWVNTDNRRVLGELFPNLYIEEQPRPHAFVMDPRTSMDYAVKVGLFVQDFIDNTYQGNKV